MANQYQQYSTVRKYWHLMRPHTLTAAVVPVLVGTATAKLLVVKITSSSCYLLQC